MCVDIYQILQNEKIGQVVGVGHDWGSFLPSRLVNYHPSLFSKLVFVDIGYSAPGRGLTEQTVRDVNSEVQKHMGYSIFGYILFFQENDAARLMNAHVDSMQSLIHSRDAELGKRYMGAEGGTRVWLQEERVADPPAYRTKEDVEYDRELFSSRNGGYGPSINWYIAQLQDLNGEDDKGDLVAGKMKPLAPKLQVKSLDAGHWIMLEKPEEMNEIVEVFLKE